MSITAADIDAWLGEPEGEHLEFKEARSQFSFEKLAKYCCAIANEGGGRIILGVTDKRPRKVVGSNAFVQPEKTRRSLIDRIPLRFGVGEVQHPRGRVVVIEVPPRPVGVPIKYDKVYWSRHADSLVPMSESKLRSIFSESGHDFSSDVCPSARIEHLDSEAIAAFRRRWIEKSKNRQLSSATDEQLLRDAELVVDGGVTYAALVLFGTRLTLGRFLGQAEVVFEFRSSDASGPAQHRKEYRQGFFSFHDELWTAINLRNDTQHYQDGLFVLDIPTFDERSVREAVLNAVSHRDYHLGGSVFVRQYQRRLVVESPGGFPVGITVENVLDRQMPRNRRIAEAFARCGLVERAGQGMNLMFERSIRQGKARPDFTGSDDYLVVLTLNGDVTDTRFVRFIERVGQETQESFDTHDFLVFDLIHRSKPIPERLKSRLRRFLDLGVLERIGRGRGTRYLLSKRFYSAIGERGSYTRRRGLDRETNKQLLFKHIRENASEGSRMNEMLQVLPTLSRHQIRMLLGELREEGRIRLEGRTNAARWHPVEQ